MREGSTLSLPLESREWADHSGTRLAGSPGERKRGGLRRGPAQAQLLGGFGRVHREENCSKLPGLTVQGGAGGVDEVAADGVDKPAFLHTM